MADTILPLHEPITGLPVNFYQAGPTTKQAYVRRYLPTSNANSSSLTLCYLANSCGSIAYGTLLTSGPTYPGWPLVALDALRYHFRLRGTVDHGSPWIRWFLHNRQSGQLTNDRPHADQ